MKILLISIPLLFCVPDSTKVDTTHKDLKLFFEQKSVEQRAEDIDKKLDLLLVRLQEKKDSTNLK